MKTEFTVDEVNAIENEAYKVGVSVGRHLEREKIQKRIEERVSDLRACHKNDNCQELASLIESYIPDWTGKTLEDYLKLLMESELIEDVEPDYFDDWEALDEDQREADDE